MSITFTLLDGLVLARSVFHHSVNYSSAVVFGTGKLVETDEEKLTALEALTERIAPGRWADPRQPNRNELDATSVIALRIESRVRQGPHRPAGRRRGRLRAAGLGWCRAATPAGVEPDRRPETERRH